MANLTRRQWLKVGLAVGGMVTFGLSYRDVAKRAIDGLLDGSSAKLPETASLVTPSSPKPMPSRAGSRTRSRLSP